jgi:HAD superfamily hydrolase (TIGR01509 family)
MSPAVERALQAIVFDMDGTLADTEEIHRQAFNRAFTEFEMPWQWSPEEYHDLLAISGGRERIRCYLMQKRERPRATAALRQLAIAVHKRKSEIYRDLLRDGHVPLRPGVRRLLFEARAAGVRLAIATSSSRRNVDTLLETTLGSEADGLFRAFATCDVVEDQKPAPALYQFALAELGVEPVHTVAIEDTHNGILAARAAGLVTVITTHRYTRDNDFPGAALVLDQLGEPDRPFCVLGGDARGATFVDVGLLRRLLAEYGPAAASASRLWAPRTAVAGK